MVEDEDAIPPPAPVGPIFVIPNKKYGLLQRGKNALAAAKPEVAKSKVKLSIFEDEDENLEEDDDVKVGDSSKPLARFGPTSSNRIKKETQIQLEKALAEDPNTFEYDNVFDDMEKEKLKNDSKLRFGESKEPKYIHGIMKASVKRKMEFEALQERKVHKERVAEGDLFKDKESFVTGAYRDKMEELKLIEEEDRKKALLEAKQKGDMESFYKTIMKVKSGELVIEEESEKEKRLANEAFLKKKETQNYRQRKEESESSEEEEEKKEEETIKIENQDKDDEISSDEETSAKPEITKEFKEPLPKKAKSEKKKKVAQVEIKEEIPVKEEEKKSAAELLADKLALKEEQKRLRREKLFTKRTVGDKFDLELSEYYLRKVHNLSLKAYVERD